MIRPRHPQNYLKKPEAIHRRNGLIKLGSNLSLNEINTIWLEEAEDRRRRGERIVEQPFLTDYPSLVYTYEWDNLCYASELNAWNDAHAKYERDLAAWKEFEEERKKGLQALAKNIDMQIVRAEHRLANLRAAKAGTPIPFPEG